MTPAYFKPVTEFPGNPQTRPENENGISLDMHTSKNHHTRKHPLSGASS